VTGAVSTDGRRGSLAVIADDNRAVERRSEGQRGIDTIERIIGYLYSTSFPLRQLLGDQRPAFERALTEALQELPDADLAEAVTVQALFATRA
jgi:hypothetical protein